jgi:hypothetical protein
MVGQEVLEDLEAHNLLVILLVQLVPLDLLDLLGLLVRLDL